MQWYHRSNVILHFPHLLRFKIQMFLHESSIFQAITNYQPVQQLLNSVYMCPILFVTFGRPPPPSKHSNGFCVCVCLFLFFVFQNRAVSMCFILFIFFFYFTFCLSHLEVPPSHHHHHTPYMLKKVFSLKIPGEKFNLFYLHHNYFIFT